jgi:hypothetical protein
MSGAALPQTDRIVVALWRLGDSRAAGDLAVAALGRSERRHAELRAQLAWLRAGHALEVGSEPLPEVDLALAQALVERYRYHEAQIVLRVIGTGSPGLGRKLGMVLEEALLPFPPDSDPSFGAVLQLVKAGQAPSALRALEEVLRQSAEQPPWLVRKQRALGALVRGHWKEGLTPVEDVTRETVLARIRSRDLPGALLASKAAQAKELSAVLERLLAMTERVFTETSDQDEPETVPIQGHRLAELQIRMGALGEADRSYRAILKGEPDDERARAQLADVILLRRALGEDPEPLPQRQATVAWLSKSAPRGQPAAKGWSSGAGIGRYARFEDTPNEDSTDVLEAAQEAELLLKLGKAEPALDMYRILAIRHPRQQVYRKRITEIEALIAQRLTPVAAEVTLRHDIVDLAKRAGPRARYQMPESVEVYPVYGADEDDDEPSTLVEPLPRRDEE